MTDKLTEEQKDVYEARFGVRPDAVPEKPMMYYDPRILDIWKGSGRKVWRAEPSRWERRAATFGNGLRAQGRKR